MDIMENYIYVTPLCYQKASVYPLAQICSSTAMPLPQCLFVVIC